MKLRKSILVLAFLALLSGCQNRTGDNPVSENMVAQDSGDDRPEPPDRPGNDDHPGQPGGGNATQAVSEVASTVTRKEATSLLDTEGNPIYSGTATFPNDGVSTSLSAAYVIDGSTVTISEGEFVSASEQADQIVFLVVNGGSLTLKGTAENPVKVKKSGSASADGQVGDEDNFYGINSAIVVAGKKSRATIKHASITTEANGANAVVSSVNGIVTIDDSTILTTGNAGSRGLHATYSGTIEAHNCSITTHGASSASLATDRGGGTVSATGCTLETNGAGSPLLYSTGTISATSCTGSANKAQIAVIEGNSKAVIESSDFTAVGTGNREGRSETDRKKHKVDSAGIMIYQSMSGDSSLGTDYFTCRGSKLTVSSEKVPLIWSSNINAEITLNGENIFSFDTSGYFLTAESTDQWGNGTGADITLTTSDDLSSYQAFVGSSSSLAIRLEGEGKTFKTTDKVS